MLDVFSIWVGRLLEPLFDLLAALSRLVAGQ